MAGGKGGVPQLTAGRRLPIGSAIQAAAGVIATRRRGRSRCASAPSSFPKFAAVAVQLRTQRRRAVSIEETLWPARIKSPS